MSNISASYSLLPPVVRILLISNFLMYFAEMTYGNPLITQLALWPLSATGISNLGISQPHFEVYQLVTYAFLHGGLMHLLLNMYALWLFGSRMENVWGPRNFVIYYLVCIISAAYLLAQTYSIINKRQYF